MGQILSNPADRACGAAETVAPTFLQGYRAVVLVTVGLQLRGTCSRKQVVGCASVSPSVKQPEVALCSLSQPICSLLEVEGEEEGARGLSQ